MKGGVFLDFVNDFDNIICEVSSVLGKPIDKTKYEIIDRGILEIGEDCWKAEKRISRYARGNAQGIKIS